MKNNSLSSDNKFRSIQTTKNALLINLFIPKNIPSFFSPIRYLAIYVLTVTVTFVLPTISILLRQPIVSNTTEVLKYPYFLDFNNFVASVFVIPFLLLWSIKEITMFPQILNFLSKDKIINLAEEDLKIFIEFSNNVFSKFNIVGQIVGLFAGMVAMSYWYISISPNPGLAWQNIGVTEWRISYDGVFFVIKYMFFYFLVAQYLSRQIGLLVVLFRLSKISKIEIKPFHPDQVGGLKPVSKIALHYQAMTTLVGIQVGAVLIMNYACGLNVFDTLGIISITAYTVLVPIAFVLPMIPFRNYMLHTKSEYLTKIGNKAQACIEKAIDETTTESQLCDFEQVEKLTNLYEQIRKLPEWPFDFKTLQKFIVIFLSPIFSVIITWAFGKIVGSIA